MHKPKHLGDIKLLEMVAGYSQYLLGGLGAIEPSLQAKIISSPSTTGFCRSAIQQGLSKIFRRAKIVICTGFLDVANLV